MFFPEKNPWFQRENAETLGVYLSWVAKRKRRGRSCFTTKRISDECLSYTRPPTLSSTNVNKTTYFKRRKWAEKWKKQISTSSLYLQLYIHTQTHTHVGSPTDHRSPRGNMVQELLCECLKQFEYYLLDRTWMDYGRSKWDWNWKNDRSTCLKTYCRYKYLIQQQPHCTRYIPWTSVYHWNAWQFVHSERGWCTMLIEDVEWWTGKVKKQVWHRYSGREIGKFLLYHPE